MRGLVVIVLLAIAAGAARADDAPWAAGVSDEAKTKAQALLDQGNTQFVEHDYAQALATYQLALAAWDHPAIRFNIVRCLIQLGRPVDAYEELEQALRYGAAPLEASVYEEALGYQKLLEGEIATIEVRCAQDAVQVTLDGRPLLACPGRAARRLAPGAHQVVARKDGFLPMTRDLVVLPAKAAQVDVSLVPLESAAITVRRWSTWKPWAVVAGGGAVALGGSLLEWRASSDFGAYDRAIAAACGDRGCTDAQIPADARAIQNRAHTENRFAVAGLLVGGAGIVTGAVLLYLNRSHTELPAFDVAPAPGGATASLTLSF